MSPNKASDDGDDDDKGAMESTEYESVSEHMRKALEKENVFYRFTDKLHNNEQWNVEYNDNDENQGGAG